MVSLKVLGQRLISLSYIVKSALYLVYNPVYHEKTNFIDVRLNFIYDILEDEIYLSRIDTKVNPIGNRHVDKVIPHGKFQSLLSRVMFVGVKSLEAVWGSGGMRE